jgi:ankyrin repeat protein
MIKPLELDNEQGQAIWETMCAADVGDTAALRHLLDKDPSLSRAEYWYQHPLHYAVRGGHLEAVRLLLDAGGDPEWNAYDGKLAAMARDRGHEAVAKLLDEACRKRGRVAPSKENHPVHYSAKRGEIENVRAYIAADPTLVNLGDKDGATPLHLAAACRRHDVITVLLDRGANIHAAQGAFLGTEVQPIDLAIWGANPLAPSTGDFETARLLLDRGAAYDLTIACAFGDLDRARAFLDEDPNLIRTIRACGRRPLNAATRFGHNSIVRLLLERGVDPNWPEAGATRGKALRLAAAMNDRELVELLLAHDADPNAYLDSGGTAIGWASPELRPLMIAHGGKLDPTDEDILRRVKEDLPSAQREFGGVFPMICGDRKREFLAQLLEAGLRVPPTLTGCKGYLLNDIEMFKMLLSSGMDPDLPNWQRQTLLHDVCGGGERGKVEKQLAFARILLDAGANISAKEEVYRSTPLGFAARNNMPDMVEFLLARGAPTNLPDDEPWATPLAWAERRGHSEIAQILRNHGVTE